MISPKERFIHILAGAAAVVAIFALARTASPRTPEAADVSETAVVQETGPASDLGTYVKPRELMRRQLQGWKRPEGPIKIAIQAGHWKSEDAPDEQDGLRTNGAEYGGKDEWEITLAIAERVVALLKQREGVEVELLPTVVPPLYYADVFVSVHADEAPNRAIGGFRTAASWLDLPGTSGALSDAIDAAYGEATGMEHYPEITDGMLQYYAFNWLLYEHSLHPMVPAVIIETGYMTNANDRSVIFNRQELAAKGIADGIIAFLDRK